MSLRAQGEDGDGRAAEAPRLLALDRYESGVGGARPRPGDLADDRASEVPVMGPFSDVSGRLPFALDEF